MTESYPDFHLQLLAGEWREGSGLDSRPVINPYSGETLLSIRSATADDLDATYQKAAAAQPDWADTPPQERAALMQRVVSIFDERKEEIIDWLIRESGSFEEAGLPAGVLSVVIGPGSAIGDDFVAHAIPAMISFTGSTSVGKNIGNIATSGRHLKKVALELGGNSPFVVLDDADVEQAVKAAVFGKFLHQGQICMAINRIIVDEGLYDRFVEAFVDHVSKLKVGDPSSMETVIGPITNQSQLEGLQQKIAQAKKQGAKVLLEGETHGQMLPPHVFGDVTPDMQISSDEIFGPLVGIQKARNEQHALELANATEFGLSSAVFSGDLDRGLSFARKIRAGMTHVNDMPVNDEAHMPFGGEKNSGLGRFNGDWAIEEFTTVQWVSVQRTPRQYPF